jgi:hypothetical protein
VRSDYESYKARLSAAIAMVEMMEITVATTVDLFLSGGSNTATKFGLRTVPTAIKYASRIASMGRATKTAKIFELTPTHWITKSESVMKKFVKSIKEEGGIKETIKYVMHNGNKYIVDGHHRFFAAQKLGLKQVPIEQVKLPYKGYKTIDDLHSLGRQPGWWKYFKP